QLEAEHGRFCRLQTSDMFTLRQHLLPNRQCFSLIAVATKKDLSWGISPCKMHLLT
ncbi:unnamed protein product, partial [Arabidopsis halleri]